MTIEVKVIADSISESGKRICTVEMEYPRFIHAENLTHRLFSRNSSSCLTGDTKITIKNPCDTRNGKPQIYYKTIKEIVDDWFSEDRTKQANIKHLDLYCLNENTDEFELTHVTNCFRQGKQHVYSVTLVNGLSITMTSTHRFYTTDGWKTLSEYNLLMEDSTNHVIHDGKIAKIATSDNTSINEYGTVASYFDVDTIEYVGEMETYDIEVKGPFHNFIGNGIVVHNSRAIPVSTAINLIRENTAMPSHWGKNQRGMQAKEEWDEHLRRNVPYVDENDELVTNSEGNVLMFTELVSREQLWNEARDCALEYAEIFNDLKYHKQIVNRLIEPFSHIKVCLTSTDFSNYFWLRDHSDAQPEIMILAQKLKEALDNSTPIMLKYGEWHVPYYIEGYWKPCDGDTTIIGRELRTGIINDTIVDKYGHTLSDVLIISASCSAQTSYRRTNDSLEKAKEIYEKLVGMEPPHFSPFEHQATPMESDVNFDHCAITHLDRYGHYWSGNFERWIQHRQLIMNNKNIKLMNSIKE